jgi:hypothetical protein
MIQLQEKISDTQATIDTDPGIPRQYRRALFLRLRDLNAELRELGRSRRRTLFDEAVNTLALPQNRKAFTRMVKNKASSRGGNHCKLDPAKIDEHANYYRSTFGSPSSEPAYEPDVYLMEEDISPFSVEAIINTLRNAPLGKAAGCDGLMGEIFRYGGHDMALMLTALFNKIFVRNSPIPQEWKTALIVPIYKQKGSDQDAANYRPIALTCCCRRLYEQLLAERLDSAVLKLSHFQGGFRIHRSTLDQVYCLAEIMKRHPGLHNIYLDLKAAYDLVERQILWQKMHRKFEVEFSLIKRLQQLFDHNESCLVINGETSSPVANTRGLLQGSSLSPILFNFYINDLIMKIYEESNKVNTGGYMTNCLFFADDGNIHGHRVETMQAMLDICSEWSASSGMKFAANKCFYVGPLSADEDGTVSLNIYGTRLPKASDVQYLGVTINDSGIDWNKHISDRTGRADKMTHLLADYGMNLYGWPTESSTLVYKMFIRPRMEYALALSVLCPKLIGRLMQVQKRALRRISGGTSSASINAMHRLLRIETMQVRNEILSAKFFGKLKNSLDPTIPATKLFHIMQQERNSMASLAAKNPVWRRCQLRNPITSTMITDGEPEGIRQAPLADVVKSRFFSNTFSH